MNHKLGITWKLTFVPNIRSNLWMTSLVTSQGLERQLGHSDVGDLKFMTICGCW